MSGPRAPAARLAEPGDWFVWSAVAASIVVGVIYLRVHAPWRDELQAWALVRASGSPAALFEHLRAEGHPILWYALLAALQLLTHHWLAMAVLHSACACAAIYLLIRFAPFSKVRRALIACSSLVLVEYFAIARGYVLVELLLFATCVELCGRRRVWVMGLLFVLLAQSELQGALLALSLCAAWLFSEYSNSNLNLDSNSHPRRAALARLMPAVALCAVSAALSFFQVSRRVVMEPAAGSAFSPMPYRQPFILSARDLLRVLCPLFEGDPASRWLDAHPGLFIPGALALLAALTCALLRSRLALLFWLASCAANLLLADRVALARRHLGIFFLAFVAALWLSESSFAPRPPARGGSALFTRIRGMFLLCFFGIQARSGVSGLRAEAREHRSEALSAARYLREHQLAGLPMICDIDYSGQGVVALLDRACFFPSIQAESRFTTWGPRRRPVGQAELARAVADQLQRSPTLILILSHRLEAPIAGASLLASFEDVTPDGEPFFLYRVVAPPTP